MNLYKINETLQHSYYQMPQELFCNEKYKKLSIEAKVIYAFLLNRMNLSRMNKWINDKGEIYLIYTRKEIQSKLNLSDKPVIRAFKELRETNLIKEERQGFGKPNLIYIGKIEYEELQNSNINTNDYRETNDILIDNRIKEDYCVEENTIQGTEYLRANKKDNIKHKNNNIDVSQSEREAKNLEDIKQKCELYLFKENQRNIIENTLDIMFYSDNLKVGQAVLPQEIEDICIQQTIEENGEMLNYETTPIYSELVVDEFEIEGVYYISYGEHELAKDYERAKKVADERGLPLIERDISKYRAEHGLEPMTAKAKMNLCRNILWKCCAGDRELEQAYSQFAKGFIKSNFKDFYEKFMQLKKKPEFSKEDILRAFADVARGDIDFGKISQNIDEMYLREEQKETIQAMQEYGLTDIQDVQTLQQRLEKCISDGIFYGEDQQNPKK